MLDESDLSKPDAYIMCVPLSYRKEPPEDQQECQIEKCPVCDADMWVSIKKRKIREKFEIIKSHNLKMWCGFCVAKECLKENNIPNYTDISNMDID